MREESRRSATLIITPQVLPGLLRLVAQRNTNPLRVRWLICEYPDCERSRGPFTVVNQAHDLCPDCQGPCLSMDDQEELEAKPGQPIGRIEVIHCWDRVKRGYLHQVSLQVANFDHQKHGTYIRYMPRSSAVTEKKLVEFLYSVNYRRTCDSNLELGPTGNMEHVLDLSDSFEDLQVSLADLESAWEANPLCPK